MKTYLNRTQLAARLGVAPKTLAAALKVGTISPDARDGIGKPLFDARKHFTLKIRKKPTP